MQVAFLACLIMFDYFGYSKKNIHGWELNPQGLTNRVGTPIYVGSMTYPFDYSEPVSQCNPEYSTISNF